MGYGENGTTVPESELSPRDIALKRWGVDIDDVGATLLKVNSLHDPERDQDEGDELTSLWAEHEDKKKKK